jgi:hypothetical protein
MDEEEDGTKVCVVPRVLLMSVHGEIETVLCEQDFWEKWLVAGISDEGRVVYFSIPVVHLQQG